MTAGNQENSGDESSLEFIKLTVVDQENRVLFYRCTMSMPLKKLKREYNERVGLPVGSVRFLFDGRRISDDDTPRQLKMEQNDKIEVYREQTGGIYLRY